MRTSPLISAAALLLASTNAQTLQKNVSYENTLTISSSFRIGSGSVTVNNDGILITIPPSENTSAVLSGLEVVYAADNGDNVLLTENCFIVYPLVDAEGNEVTWSSCQEFDFGGQAITSSLSSSSSANSLSASYTLSSSSSFLSFLSSSSSPSPSSPSSSFLSPVSSLSQPSLSNLTSSSSSPSSTTTLSDTLTATAASTSSSSHRASSAEESSVLTTVTTTISGVVTSYTTYCPLSTIVPKETSVLTTVTSTINGEVTIFTTYCPLTTESAIVPSIASTGFGTTTYTKTSNGIVSTVESVSTFRYVLPSPESVVYNSVDTTVTTTASDGKGTTYTTATLIITTPSTAVENETETVVQSLTKTSNSQAQKPTQTTVISLQSSAVTSTSAAVSTFEGYGVKLNGPLSIMTIVSIFFGLLL